MSRTEYVASKPTSVLPFPRTRLLGTISVARQILQFGHASHPHHHVTQASPHSGRPDEIGRARAARAGDNAALRARALGRGHEPAPGEAGRAPPAVRRPPGRADPPPQRALLRRPAVRSPAARSGSPGAPRRCPTGCSTTCWSTSSRTWYRATTGLTSTRSRI